jgi:hypothetical protein
MSAQTSKPSAEDRNQGTPSSASDDATEALVRAGFAITAERVEIKVVRNLARKGCACDQRIRNRASDLQ